jgi:hypothetical protein
MAHPAWFVAAAAIAARTSLAAPTSAGSVRPSDPCGSRVLPARIYRRAIARGRRHPHAIRILARAWIRIIWRCWQNGVAFDPSLHEGRQPVTA